MKVQIVIASRGHYTRGGAHWKPAFLLAYVDGNRVTCLGNGKGWDCACKDPECRHVDATAAVLHPDLLEALEAEDDNSLRPPKDQRRRGFGAPGPQEAARLPVTVGTDH